MKAVNVLLLLNGLSNSTEWEDLSKKKALDENGVSNEYKADSTIKAFTVSNAVDHSLKNIEIQTPPTKTTYFVGENFDKTGMVVKANYNDDTSKIITDYTITNGSNLTLNQQYVTISYEDKEVKQNINVIANTLESIVIDVMPNKTTYYVGESFDSTGMVIKAVYKNGASSEITGYQISGGTNLQQGEQTITISYDNKKVTLKVQVLANTVESLTIVNEPNKKSYYVGENFDKSGMTVKAVYKNGTSKIITDYTVIDGENLKEGQQYVTISYEGKEVRQSIEVKKKTITLSSITIQTPPTKTIYFVGENFDKTGMVIKANYSDGTSKLITDYTVTDGTNLQEGQQNVTISYGGKQVQQSIEVKKKTVTLTSITIQTPPTKTKYFAGENFDVTGMVVKANYNDGTSKVISKSEYSIINGTNLQEGQQNVTISYGGKEAIQSIEVVKNSIESITITTPPTKTTYFVGENFDKTGMTVKATYKNGISKNITDYTINDGMKLKKDQQYVTISYEGQTVTQKINVIERLITNISIAKLPNKVEYVQNKEELELAGGFIKVEYNDGSDEQILMTDKNVTVSGFTNKKIGKVEITLTYQSKKTTFNIIIVEAKTAINSDFDDVKCIIPLAQGYQYTKENQKDYYVLQINLKNVIRVKENQTFEYYYYLSPNQSENEIEDWVKIDEEQNVENELNFKINTKQIKNFKEIADASELYVYIKEVAKREGEQRMYISDAIEIEADNMQKIESYVDDVLVDGSSTGNNEKPDNTIAEGTIPQTGLKVTIIIAIAIITISAVVIYIKYVKFSKEIK